MICLRIDLTSLAPVDQVLWSAWGVSVLEASSGGELVLGDAPQGLAEALATSGSGSGVVVRSEPVSDLASHQRFAAVSSAGLVTPALLACAGTLHVFPGGPVEALAAEWLWDGRWLADFRARVEATGAAVMGASRIQGLADALARIRPWQPEISLVSSVFKADRFLNRFLANSTELVGYRDAEHWLLRPGSPGEEHPALLAHVKRWRGAVYLNLETDPGLYETWNLGSCLARGRLLSNANVDDRRHPEQLQRLISALESRPWADLASAALRVTREPNQDWADWTDGPVFFAEGTGGEYGAADLVREVDGERRPRNLPHCMPLWRRALHGLRGFFNEAQYGPSADWEYWLRCAEAGSRFYRTSEALGLYLQREDSYWRRDPTARRFDERILASYGNGNRPADADAAPVRSLPWRELTRFEQTGHWCGVWLTLMRLAADPGTGDGASARRALIEAKAKRYFGVEAIAQLPPQRFLGESLAVMSSLLPHVLDALHHFVTQPDADQRRSAQARRWHQLLVDWYALTGDITALVAVAFLQRHLRDAAAAEAEALRRAYALDPSAFWRVLQHAYRFSVPLQALNKAAGGCPAVEPDARATDLSNTHLWYFPAYTNKYQELLYWRPARRGLKAQGVNTLAELEALRPVAGAENILHLHWMNAVFQDPAVPFETEAVAFLGLVAAKQRAGFAVYWTVHNRLNHDSLHPEAERAFRAHLAQLVDRVYLHHPMLRPHLDWWPDEVQPWLCEHGPYLTMVHGDRDRAMARQRLDLDPDARVFLWFGQVRPYKGLIDWLPSILEALTESPGSLLIIAGRSQVPEVQELLGHYPERARIIDRFIPNTELQHLASAADFGLLTYRDILTSGAMFQFYSLGLPVIAPDQGILPGYVVPGWNGFLYEDASSLAEIIRSTCRFGSDTLNCYRAAARKTGVSLAWGTVV